MNPFNIGKLPFEVESSASSSSSSSDDDVVILAAFHQHQQQVEQEMLLLAQLVEAATQHTPSASRPRMKKRCI